MELIQCKECGKGTLDTFKECPFCGVKLERQEQNANNLSSEEKHNKQSNDKKQNNTLITVISIIIGTIFLIAGSLLMSNGTNKILNGNNRVNYDKNTDTYTIIIWESK